jgi:putative endonuclease
MAGYNKRIGDWGESMAVSYLETNQYQIIGRNVRTRNGEIDIVAKKDNLVVFVEVKTRTSSEYGFPEQAVTPRKQARMLAVAESFIAQAPAAIESWQFDVISIEGKPGATPVITHFENVIA